MKTAKFVISEQILVQALDLPQGTRILAIEYSNNSQYNDYLITIANDQLKDLVGYYKVPEITPIFIRTTAPCGHTENIEVLDWGYPKDDEN